MENKPGLSVKPGISIAWEGRGSNCAVGVGKLKEWKVSGVDLDGGTNARKIWVRRMWTSETWT